MQGVFEEYRLIAPGRGKKTMDLKQLQYFIVCAQCGSMSKAAEQLYTSQPHVSAVIKSLERDLSVVLFSRMPSGITLTRQGEHVYDYAQNILKDLEHIELSCQKAGMRQLSIMSNSSKRMGVFFSKFYEKHFQSDISFTYLEGGLEKILDNLVSGRIELGFSFVAENRKNICQSFCKRHQLEYEVLSCSDMVLYVGKNHPLYTRKSVAVEKLKNLRYVQMEEDYFGLDDLLLRLLPMGESVSRIVTTNSNNGILQMLLNTQLCNLGSFWMKDIYMDRDIRLIPIEGYEKKIYFVAIYQELSWLGREYLNEVKTALLWDGITNPDIPR